MNVGKSRAGCRGIVCSNRRNTRFVSVTTKKPTIPLPPSPPAAASGDIYICWLIGVMHEKNMKMLRLIDEPMWPVGVVEFRSKSLEIISEMESGGFTKEWSTEPKTIITGQPPDEQNATEKETTTSEVRRHDMRFITPFYKTKQSSEKPGIDSELKRETTMQTNYDQIDRPADYKVEKQAEYYKLRMIDPKAEPPKTSIISSQTLPAEFLRKKKNTDFPSSHSKRSFVKLNPLERPQRQRLRSLEVRPITPHDYLSESLERHRAMSLSPLRSKLKINEKCVNEAWERLPRPEKRIYARKNSRTSEINLSQLHGNEKLTTCDLMKSPRFAAFGMKDHLNDRFDRRCVTPLSIVTPHNLQHNVQQKSYITRTESRSLPKPRQHQEAQDLSEMAQIREKLLERARNRSTVNVNEVSKVEAELLPIPPLLTKSQSQVNLSSWEFKNSFSPRSIVSVNGHMQNPGLLRIRTDLSPALPKSLPRSSVSVQTVDQTNTSQMLPLQAVLVPIDASALTREWTREYRTTHEIDGKLSSGDTEETESRHSTLIKIKDEKAKKPKSIMKQQQKRQETRKHESKWEKETENEQNRVIKESPQVTETIEKIEETMTTEEIERRVRGRSRKEKRDRHRRKGEHSHHRDIDKYGNSINWHSRHGVADDPPWTVPFGMSPDSPWRNRPMISGTTEQRYYSSQPQVKESYHREVKSKRVNDTSLNGSNYYNAPDSRRDHFWDGDYRRNDSHFHKSHSSRNVFHNEFADSFDNPYPIVEFPPTLPREDYNDSREHHVPKTRSLSDWREDSRASDMSRFRRWDNEMSGLEREFHQSLLMPVSPGQNLRECQYTEQAIPGGHESFRREVTSHSGIRPRSHRNDGQTTHFSESKQEVHYKKEHTADHF
ncbi:hypothetical protein T02_4124 [Trichinella nativa]|uniref:Uncharacterized protein n=1 Tax=Trichinella nativa TaxID=6335 RepID=A0A0V1LK77_9BILA|nr:hypothetical protein T02_4124 [Trichinella nativa]